jgi:replicative DNA helicase
MEKVQPSFERSNKSPQVVSFERGKLPPQAIDLEEVVLGAMMIDKKGVDAVIDILHSDAFYKESHQLIFESIVKLFENTEPIDLLTVSAKLRTDGKDNAESKLYDVTQGNIKKSTETAQSLVIQAKKKIEEISNKDGLSGVPSGFSELDKLTSGWQPSDLVIIAARPGMGKTALTLSMARNMAVAQNIPVAFFSLEMSSIQLITRLISSETGLSSEKLRTGNLEKFEWEQLNVKVSALENAPLYIDDTPSLSIFDLRAKARRLSSQFGIKLIVIDYLQLMSAGGSNKNGNREQEISTISRNLKALAKELNVPVIALSQLSRAVETRGGSKRPILSDLRESGAIEQDADIVSFIYRPEYYKIDEWDDEERTPSAGQAEFIVAKHRNGGLSNIKLKFVPTLGKFENLDNFDTPFEYQSKINQESTKVNPDQAFESGGYRDENEDMPF